MEACKQLMIIVPITKIPGFFPDKREFGSRDWFEYDCTLKAQISGARPVR